MFRQPDRRAARLVSQAMKATAVSHPNIALVKYWGKRDEERVLPHQSSLSVTLDGLCVTTTVELGAPQEEIRLNRGPAKEAESARIRRVLAAVQREISEPLGKAKVISEGNFPAAAGLASSAAGFAALATAARAAAKLRPDVRAASRLARIGSGSACRSIQGGTCVWRRGILPDGSDSYAEQAFPEQYWPELRLVVCIVSEGEKEVSSREGMRRTVETSPFYSAWVSAAEADIDRALEYVRDRNLPKLGELAERNAWRMHATALSADPPICYFGPATLRLIAAFREARKGGLPVWFTLDAGPNPVALTDEKHLARVESLCRESGSQRIVVCAPGGDARLIDEHLF